VGRIESVNSSLWHSAKRKPESLWQWSALCAIVFNTGKNSTLSTYFGVTHAKTVLLFRVVLTHSFVPEFPQHILVNTRFTSVAVQTEENVIHVQYHGAIFSQRSSRILPQSGHGSTNVLDHAISHVKWKRFHNPWGHTLVLNRL